MTQATDRLSMYHEIRLVDPGDCNEIGHPKHVAVVGLLLNQPREVVLDKRNVNKELTRAIIRILEPAERRELLEGRSYIQYERCCARCGSSLGLRSCSGCGRAFRDDQFETTRGINLPPQVRTWLEARGHVFER